MKDITNSLFYKKDWRWSDFLKFTIEKLNQFDVNKKVLPPEFVFKESIYGSKKLKNKVQLFNWSVQSNKIQLARAVCINSPTYSVFNFLIIPKTNFNVPFFGVDFVTLPNLHLIVLDFQPSLTLEKQFDKKLLIRIINMKNKCHRTVPSAEKMPIEVRKFFSPGVIWSKLSKDKQSEKLISGEIYQSFTEYLNLYLEILFKTKEVKLSLQNEIIQGQKYYLDYRKEKDPARPMLTNLFGKEFTELLINKVLFTTN